MAWSMVYCLFVRTDEMAGGVTVRQMVGSFILGIVAIVASILAVALHWPWSWWVWVVVVAPCVVGGILMIWRDRKSPELQRNGSEKNVATASGDRSVALNNNFGIVSTGDDVTIER
jgi:hypothetical protein